MESGSCQITVTQRPAERVGSLIVGKENQGKHPVDPDGGCRVGKPELTCWASSRGIGFRDILGSLHLLPLWKWERLRGKNQERCQLLMRAWMCEADSCSGCGLAFWAGCCGLWVSSIFRCGLIIVLRIFSLSKATQCKFVALGSSLHLQSLWFCISHSFLYPSSHLPFSYPVMFMPLPLWPHFGCLSQMAIYFRGSHSLTVISPASIILWMRRILRH